MCYVVCSARRVSSVDTLKLPDVPPPPMSAQSKKEKRRFRKSLKAVVSKIMCRGTPKPDCACLSVVEEKASMEETSGDFVRIDVDVDVITDAPSLLNTSFGEEHPVLTDTTVPVLLDLELPVESAPEFVVGASSIVGEVKPEYPPASPPVDTAHLDGLSALALDANDTASAPVPPTHRRALGGGARDEVAFARRGQNCVSKKPSRDQTTEKKGQGTVRVPLADVTNHGTKVDSHVGVIAQASTQDANKTLSISPVLKLAELNEYIPCTPVSRDVVVLSEVASAPTNDSKRIDEESALQSPVNGVNPCQEKACVETPGAARTPAPVSDSPPIHACTELSIDSGKLATPVLPSLVRRVDLTPISGVSVGSSGTPDLFSPATPGTLVDSSFAPTETSPPVRPHFKKAVTESPDVSHTFIHETNVKASAASPDPKAALEIPAFDLPIGLLGTVASQSDTGSQKKVYADACVEAQPPCETADKRAPVPCAPALPQSQALRAIVGNILAFAAASAHTPVPEHALPSPPKAGRISAGPGPTIPLDEHGTPCMTRAACEDLRQLIQAEQRAADTRRAILDTMGHLLAKHEPPGPASAEGEQGIIGYEVFVQRSLAAEEEWERDMGGVVSALMQLACVPRAASSPRAISSPSPASQPLESVLQREATDEEDPFKRMRRDLAGAAAKKALLFEGQRTLRAVERREQWRAESAPIEVVKLRETGLLGKEKEERREEDEEAVNAKKLRYQQYVARKAYEKRIGQMKDEPVPLVKTEVKPVADAPAAGLVVPGTPQKGKLSPPASPSRLPMPVPANAVGATTGGVSVSPLRATFDRLKATVSAMATHPPSRTPGRKTVRAPTKPPVTPVASRAPSTTRLQPTTPKSVNPRTPSSVRGAPTQSRMTTPRSSRPTTPCPNPGAHKLSTPERKPPVPRVTSRQAVGPVHTTSTTKLAVPRNSPSVPGTPRRGGQTASRGPTPKATPSRRGATTNENAPPSPRRATEAGDALPKSVSGRQLLRTPLRTKQAETKSPARPAFRF